MRTVSTIAVTLMVAAVPGAAVASEPDRDHDRLPDRWERRHEVKRAGADNDRDGLTNLREYRAGTNPLRRDSDRDGAWDGAEGAGQIAAVDGDGRITIVLGNGHPVTGTAVLPFALTCGTADEWNDVPASARVRDDDVTPLSAYAARIDFEPEEEASGTWAPEQDLTEAELEAREHREALADGDDVDDGLSDECPAGALTPGRWVHEVELSVSAESGIEFEEIVLVR